MTNIPQTLSAKLKDVEVFFVSGSNAANVVVALIVFLAIIFGAFGAIKDFLPLAYISIIALLLILAFKPNHLRDNKFILADRKLKQQEEKNKSLTETIEGEVVQPVFVKASSAAAKKKPLTRKKSVVIETRNN